MNAPYAHLVEANSDAAPIPDAFRRAAHDLLERAIGVVYRPETELDSHYFQAVLPEQFDEYVWFDRTRAVDALGSEAPVGVPDTYPFAL